MRLSVVCCDVLFILEDSTFTAYPAGCMVTTIGRTYSILQITGCSVGKDTSHGI